MLVDISQIDEPLFSVHYSGVRLFGVLLVECQIAAEHSVTIFNERSSIRRIKQSVLHERLIWKRDANAFVRVCGNAVYQRFGFPWAADSLTFGIGVDGLAPRSIDRALCRSRVLAGRLSRGVRSGGFCVVVNGSDLVTGRDFLILPRESILDVLVCGCR